MSTAGHRWQKSSFSAQASNCINVGVTDDGSLLLRESTAPDAVLNVPAAALRGLLSVLRSGPAGDQ
ncbi:hypothetical protein GCM10010218_29040 [Streptomyces mashuensis]|uniref:DUF397 domain-containing protein n=1 Tax=Streptomyces mashuensis TaxID=33904 RepID=A0A919B368_9ACTN|nr:DUF397 domain-containing protein [Streptomyces mashuensis]GHF45998.1 hypothetical protein GCM10010218_29040 [Streptomyces mashuensis]